MKKCVPDRKWRLLCNAVESGVEPRLPELVPLYKVKTGQETDELSEYVFDMLEDPFKRDMVTAYLLSGASHDVICASLYIADKKAVVLFQWLFVNPDEFRDKMDIFIYARMYVADVATDDGGDLVQLGVRMGAQALVQQLRYGDDVIKIDTKKLVSEMAAQAYHLSMVSKANPITSKAAQQAHRWMSQTEGLLSMYDKLKDASEETDALHIEIEKRRVTRTAEEAKLLPEAILH